MAKIDPMIIEELALFAAKNAVDGNVNETTKKLLANFHEAVAVIKEYDKQLKKEKKQAVKTAKEEKKENNSRKKQTEKASKKKKKSKSVIDKLFNDVK